MTDITKGDLVYLNPSAISSFHDHTNGLPYDWRDLAEDGTPTLNAKGPFEVTRASTNIVWVRVPDAVSNWRGSGQPTTISFYRENDPVRLVGTDYVPPRKLGQTPTDQGDVISVDDPRIAWLWDDLATYATRQQWCGQYDQLAAGVGIPGRKKAFTARNTVAGGFDVTRTYQARSQAEADAMLTADLAAAKLAPIVAA